MLGRESLQTAGARAVLEVKPRRLEVDQPLRLELRLVDALLIDQRRSTVAAVLESEDGQIVRDLELRRLPDEEDRYAVTYIPTVTGPLQVRLVEPSLPGIDLRVPVEVYARDDELRRPETDHALLADLAEATGGAVLDPGQIDQLPGLLPNRAVRTLNPLRERIWDTPLAFALVLLTLTAEWIGRKILRFV